MSSTASSSIAECSGDPACPSNGGDDDEKPTIDSDPPYCEIAGQNDYYGFGVRLGIYCSWVTSWIANNFLPGEMSVSFDTNSIFLAAISVTVLSYLHKDRIPIIDALIMQQLGSGFVLSVMSLWSYRTRYYRKRRRGGNGHFGGWGTHCRLILCAAISLPTQAVRWAKTWVFAPVSIYPLRVRILNAILPTLFCIYYGVMILAALAAAAKFNYHQFILGDTKIVWAPQHVHENPNARDLYILLSAFKLFWGIYVGMMVEMTLSHNFVTNVMPRGSEWLTPGQLLPMFIGIFSFVRICWLLFREYYWWPHRDKAAHHDDENVTGPAPSPGPRKRSSTFKSNLSLASGRKFFHHSSRDGGRQAEPLWHRLIAAWLPWLSCFKWWHEGVLRRQPSIAGPGGSECIPAPGHVPPLWSSPTPDGVVPDDVPDGTDNRGA